MVRLTGKVERPGEAVPLAVLAERINEEHRACFAAMLDTLNHAYAAGVLLLQAKAEVKHGEWAGWLEEHFDGSDRTARDYMRLARRREEIEEAKRQGAAILSISGALEYLGRKPRPLGWHNIPSRPEVGPVPGTTPLTPEQERAQRAKERYRQRLLERAEYALRSGDMDPPVGTEYAKWQHVLYEATQLREQNIPNVVDALGHNLDILLRHARPEAVGRHLGEPTNPEEAERREGLIEDLREGVAWLTRVIEEAEAARGREG